MSLSDQFLEAAAGARAGAAVDELARKLWRAHSEGHLTDADAEAVSAAVQARRAALAGEATRTPPRAVLGLPGGSGPRRGRREKVFGLGRPRALDRNAKVRIMHWARCLSRRTEKGRAYGVVTAKALAVLEALLWGFHNARSGLCFPSYETIAAAAHCARSTVAEAIKALEDAEVLSWVHRLKRVRVSCPDLFGNDGVRVVPQRTSNAYHFTDPGTPAGRPHSPGSEKATGTPNQGYFSSSDAACGGERTGRSGRKEALRGGAGVNVGA
jgi:helix-turn-helix protein